MVAGERRWPAAAVRGSMVPPCGGLLDKPSLYCDCEYMATVKEDRLQIRVNPADKALLERAAAASHLNVFSFVVQAAALKAEQVIAERSSIRLSTEAAAAFSEALEKPAEVNDRLAAALRRTRKFTWLYTGDAAAGNLETELHRPTPLDPARHNRDGSTVASRSSTNGYAATRDRTAGVIPPRPGSSRTPTRS